MIAELLSTQKERDDATREKVMEIPLSEIDPFPSHPFLVKQDEAMHSMAESVKLSVYKPLRLSGRKKMDDMNS